MAFTRVKSSGWAFGEKLTSAQMNQLDLDHSRSADIFAGGVYAPSAALDIGGSGLKLTGTGHVIPSSGQLTVQNGGDIVVQNGGQATWQSGADLIVAAGATLALSGLMTMPTGSNLLADAGSTWTMNGSIAAPLNFSGTGRVRLRTVTATDSDLTITPQTADVYYAESLSGNRTWTISDTSTANGDWMLVLVRGGTNTAAIRDPTPTQILILNPTSTPPRNSALLVRLAGTWRALPFAGWATP